ncbi:hypothetical protein [Aquimarina aggregata]|uniref:hypothetical protein n=1 Tax=Aquimarina aggregata TaxID=1642818 RepID=UPI00249216B7|nr:hypothetical protein [Aquimarina aggregata]
MLKSILNLEGAKELNRKELTTLKGGTIIGPCHDLTDEYQHPCKPDDSDDNVL